MSEKTPDHTVPESPDAGTQSQALEYPEGYVVGVLDTVEAMADAANALLTSGFLDSEVDVAYGEETANRLEQTTGRGGLTGLLMRIGRRFGVENIEMETKAHYERALREGKFVLRVATPTDERKDLATTILASHGATALNYFGRHTIEVLVPPAGG